MARQGLTPRELEMIAEERLMMDMVGDILEVCKEKDPQMARAIEETMGEYAMQVKNACMPEAESGTVEDVIRCIEEEKDRSNAERELRDRLQSLK